uniref:Uncharacterized protein n=1 Tax=Anguilla anguilla TaxID=7936 RepID=A0A0E9UTF5_ANGAN
MASGKVQRIISVQGQFSQQVHMDCHCQLQLVAAKGKVCSDAVHVSE